MCVFYDKKGNERYFDLTLGSIVKINNYLGIDITSISTDKDFFLNDVETVFRIIWTLTKKKDELFDDWLRCLDNNLTKKVLEQFTDCYKNCFNTTFKHDKKKDSSADDKEDKSFDKITYRTFLDMAGSCGCSNFMCLTPGELIDYKIAYDKGRWNIASAILAVVNNTHCTKSSDVKTPSDFNPYFIKEDEIVGDFFEMLTGGK